MILNDYVINKIKELEKCEKTSAFYKHYIGERNEIKNFKIDKIDENDLEELGLDKDIIENCFFKTKYDNKLFEYFFEKNKNIDVIKLKNNNYFDFMYSKTKHIDMIFFNLKYNRYNIVKFLVNVYDGKIIINNFKKISKVFECNNIEIIKIIILKLDMDKLNGFDREKTISLSFKFRDLEFSNSLISSYKKLHRGNYYTFCLDAITNNFTDILHLYKNGINTGILRQITEKYFTSGGLNNKNVSKETLIWILENFNKTHFKTLPLMIRILINCDAEALNYIFVNKYFIPKYNDIITIIKFSAQHGKLDVIKYIDNKYFSKIEASSNLMAMYIKINKDKLLKKIVHISLENCQLNNVKYIFKKYPYLKRRRKDNNDDSFFIDECVKSVSLNYKNVDEKMKCIKFLYNIDKNIKIHCENEEPITRLMRGGDNNKKLIRYFIRIDPKIDFDVVYDNLAYYRHYNKITEDFKKYQKSCHKNLN